MNPNNMTVKKGRLFLPLLLIIWPYLILLSALLPAGSEERYGFFLAVYTILTVAVYGLNIWNAFTWPAEGAERRLAFWDMLIKLIHIPFYLGVFAIGLLLLLSMVVPALLFVAPLFVLCLAVIDFFLMITSSMYGISAAARAGRQGLLSPKSVLLYCLFHLVFVADVISAVLLFCKIRKAHR